jgi:hypothetical protein
MSTPNDAEFTRVQSLINQTGKRLGSDATFKAQYQSDAMAALTGAGIPRDAVQRVLGLVAKAKGEDEVSGYDDYDSSGGYHYTLDNPHNW